VKQNLNPNPSFTSLGIQNTKIVCHRTAYEYRYRSVSKPKEVIDISATMSRTDALKENTRVKLTSRSALSTIIDFPAKQQLITMGTITLQMKRSIIVRRANNDKIVGHTYNLTRPQRVLVIFSNSCKLQNLKHSKMSLRYHGHRHASAFDCELGILVFPVIQGQAPRHINNN